MSTSWRSTSRTRIEIIQAISSMINVATPPNAAGVAPEFLDTLRRIVGASNVLVEGDLGAWEQDWRQRSRGKALAVVRPATTIEVAQVVKSCVRHRVPVVCQG